MASDQEAGASLAVRPAVLLIAAMVCGYVLLAGLAIWQDREQALDAAEERAGQLVMSIAQHTARVIETATQILHRALAGGPDPAGLTELAGSSASIVAVWLRDDAGTVLAASAGGPPVGARLVIPGAESAPGDLHLGTPLDLNGEKVIPIRLRGEGGITAALALAPSYFPDFYRSLTAGRRSTMGLIHAEGALLAREPHDPARIGASASGSRMWTRFAAGEGQGLIRAVSPMDGEARIGAWQALGDMPAMVYVATAERDALAGWRRNAWRLGAVTALGVALTLALGALVIRRIRRETAMRQALADRSRELARAHGDLRQFAYVASHDLRQPVRQVASYVALLSKRYQGRLDDDAEQYIQFAREAAVRIHEQLADLLVYLGVARAAQKVVPVSLAGALARAREDLGEELSACRLEVYQPESLPVLAVEGPRLQRLLRELLHNAVTYRHPGRDCRIRVSAHRESHMWRIDIADNGVGIEPGQEEKIFRLFQRLDVRADGGQTGMGLALAARIVETAGGRIWVTSTPGAGSTFHFTLPDGTQPDPGD